MKDRCAYCVAIIRSDPEGRELPVADTNLGEPSSSALLPPKAQDYANERAAHLGVAVPTKNVVHRKKCYDAVKRENEAVRQEQSLQRLTRNQVHSVYIPPPKQPPTASTFEGVSTCRTTQLTRRYPHKGLKLANSPLSSLLL